MKKTADKAERFLVNMGFHSNIRIALNGEPEYLHDIMAGFAIEHRINYLKDKQKTDSER